MPFREVIPKVSKICPRINVTPAKLKLKDSCRDQCVAKPFKCCKFVPFNINLHHIKLSTLKLRLPVVFESSCVYCFCSIKRNVEVVELTLCKTS